MVLFDEIDVIYFMLLQTLILTNDLCAEIDYNYFNDSQSAVNNQRNFRRSLFRRRLNSPCRFDDYV